MKSNVKFKLMLSLAVFCLGMIALSAHANEMSNESGTYDDTTVTSPAIEKDALDAFTQNEYILDSGKNVRYMKNPCAGIKGYRFQRVRGFGFENGVVKKFQLNGQLTTENTKYKSLGSFLRTRKLCEPQYKKLPSLHVNIYMTEIW